MKVEKQTRFESVVTCDCVRKTSFRSFSLSFKHLKRLHNNPHDDNVCVTSACGQRVSSHYLSHTWVLLDTLQVLQGCGWLVLGSKILDEGNHTQDPARNLCKEEQPVL